MTSTSHLVESEICQKIAERDRLAKQRIKGSKIESLNRQISTLKSRLFPKK